MPGALTRGCAPGPGGSVGEGLATSGGPDNDRRSQSQAAAHALRSKPVGTLTVEDLRLLIGQDIGLAVLLPLAVEVLRDDPLAEGHMYEGDLLRAVLTRPSAVWSDHPDVAGQLASIISDLSGFSSDLMSEAERFLDATRSS
ncbi:contact-dependent growth inhibition system immunity protein [Streptomyces sp. NPDC127038]|uniref:contact-dependent growth inhibition system immunity protein n=1 Tax=Streptomyces sp. NPDC127038 TaxID=3347114 RepID=UPI00364AFA91